MHWQGAQHFFMGVDVPHKRLLVTPPAHTERPFHEWHDEILRWYDYWLKGNDNGVADEPPVKIWVMGLNKWRKGSSWPLPETQWTKYYLHSWEKLDTKGHLPAAQTFVNEPADAFVQMPPTQTNRIERLRYMTEPLAEDTLVIGPISLTIYASLDQDDTNWIVILKDLGPDVSVQTGRPGEREVPADLHERELTRGWLKASHRVVDPKRSKPWKPWHFLSPDKIEPVVPGEVNEYQIEILSTANLFKKGHRICLEITSLDLAEGVAGETSVEYIPNHVCSSKTVLHKVYHNAEYPSHLLLPVIPV
jgi:predicted acyl esterase